MSRQVGTARPTTARIAPPYPKTSDKGNSWYTHNSPAWLHFNWYLPRARRSRLRGDVQVNEKSLEPKSRLALATTPTSSCMYPQSKFLTVSTTITPPNQLLPLPKRPRLSQLASPLPRPPQPQSSDTIKVVPALAVACVVQVCIPVSV